MLLPIGVFLSTVAAICNASCGASSAVSNLTIQASGTPERLAVSRAPVSNPGEIDLYAFPMTSTSTPVATLASTNEAPLGLAFDETGRLFGAAGDGRIKVYDPPFRSGANPAFILTTGGGALAFDRGGDLFIGGGDVIRNCGTRFHFIPEITPKIKVVNAPITGSSTVTFTIAEPTTCGGYLVSDIAFDGAGNLWAAIVGRLDEFSPPFTSNSTPALSISTCASSLGFDSAGNMYVDGCDGIDVFQPPFTSSMTKAYTISSAAEVDSIVFDSAGNMYARSLVPFSSTNGLQVFAPPFSSTSQPITTFSGNFAGVAAGR
ncbi:MAG TPA: hypothetical protein VID24_04420 [Candidatus Eremiobacteraceae bacterium]